MKLFQLCVDLPLSDSERVVEQFEDQALSVAIDLSDDETATIKLVYDDIPTTLVADLAILQQLIPSMSYRLEPVEWQDWLATVGRTEGAGHIGQFRLLDAPSIFTRLVTYKDIYVKALNAFGDGYHPTTQGCLKAMQYLHKKADFYSIADIGCGSGVLALSARKLWPQARLVASDLDPKSVDTTRINRKHNAGLKLHVAGGAGFSHRSIGQRQPYDLILMNILARPLSRLAAPAHRHLTKGGCMILSGLLTGQKGMLLAAYRAQGLALIHQSVQDDWMTLILRKQSYGTR